VYGFFVVVEAYGRFVLVRSGFFISIFLGLFVLHSWLSRLSLLYIRFIFLHAPGCPQGVFWFVVRPRSLWLVFGLLWVESVSCVFLWACLAGNLPGGSFVWLFMAEPIVYLVIWAVLFVVVVIYFYGLTGGNRWAFWMAVGLLVVLCVWSAVAARVFYMPL
jgi:hypothetical protein